ncbi:hypothetical protein D3C85_1564650 [compost metagenome]
MLQIAALEKRVSQFNQTRFKISLQNLQHPERGEDFKHIDQGEISFLVTLTLKSQHSVRPNSDSTVNHTSQMHAQKWHGRIGNGVNQVIYDLIVLLRQ